MNYFVKVTPNAKYKKVLQISPNTLHVWVTAPPVDGRANEALLELLADYFQCRKSAVYLKAGHTSRTKIVSITATE